MSRRSVFWLSPDPSEARESRNSDWRRGASAAKDWHSWHDLYAVPRSGFARRLAVVQEMVKGACEKAPPGRFAVLDICAGQGMAVIPVLAAEPRATDWILTLIECHLENCRIAEQSAAESGLSGVRVIRADAGRSDTYVGLEPADLVILSGVLRHLSSADAVRTLTSLPEVMAADGTLIWTYDGRHRRLMTVDEMRRAIRAAGFEEMEFRELTNGMVVGRSRLTCPPRALRPGRRWFRFGSAIRRSPFRRVLGRLLGK